MPDHTQQNSELSPVKQALLEIRRLNTRLSEIESRQHEPIAITGIGLRFPGSDSPETFWQMLVNGVDAIQEVPVDRWDLEAFYSSQPQTPGKMNTRWGAFLADVDQFDPHFFGISPREANSMDPQQRLLLETAWEALERAGNAPEQLFGSRTGVFLGISNSDYYRMLLNDIPNIDAYVSTGNALSVASGRLSYTLGMHGPNLAVDTACSSSLVALHLACKSLRSGETDMALAGGVNLILSPELNINFSIANMMAPDGRCKTFDASANGYVRGEGCGVIVLKRLSDAQKANDPILALIRGTSINHDGRSGGLTAPNGPAQVEVIRHSLLDAGVAPHDVSYIETHGTGTSLGDPIEVGALLEAYCQNRSTANHLFLGAVKTNFGHLEAAAGIAGVIKAVLSLQNRQIPPNLHFNSLNPHIQLGDAPVVIPVQNTPWTIAEQAKRFAGISSFGLSGTNAHVILEEAPESLLFQEHRETNADRGVHLLALSARTSSALNASVERIKAYLESAPAVNFADICSSANTGRSQFENRLAIVAQSSEDALHKIQSMKESDETEGIYQGKVISSNPPEVTFLFTGHGATYARMGQRLYNEQPVFRAVMDRCDEALRSILDQPLLPLLYPKNDGNAEGLSDMRYAQPAMFAVQMALAELWKSWGVEPAFVMGHSAGEYAAACLSGVFSLEDALKLVCGRGQLLQSIPHKGHMVAIFAAQDLVANAIVDYSDQVSIAALNGPTNTVISGVSEVVNHIVAQFEGQGIKTRKLAIGQAAHSPLIEPALDGFQALAETIQFSSPSINLVSSLTGRLIDGSEITQADYWRRHLRQPVQFLNAMQALEQHHQKVFIEIGPNPVLISMGSRFLPGDDITWLPSLREKRDDWSQILESLANLWVAGGKVNWAGFDQPYLRRRVNLPTYPFQHNRYWTGTSVSSAPTQTLVSPWVSASSAAQRQSHQGPLDLLLPTYNHRWDVLDQLSTAYMVQTLRSLDLYCQDGETWRIEDLLTHAGILPTYLHLITRWLEKLVSIGVLQKDEAGFRAARAIPVPDLEKLQQEAVTCLSDSPMVIEYIQRCGERLPGVLTGKISALDTLFPGGSGKLAEDLYQNWSLSRYFGMLVGATVEGAAQAVLKQQTPKKRKIRILEIGAGTGATTSHILPILSPELATYTFTDVSDLFLSRASEKFASYSFVNYQKLDIEKSPVDQGFQQHQYDLVIATNVLHAIPSLKQALQNTLELLVPGGLLIANEVTRHLTWFDITTGLIEGWQSFSDDLRSTSPLISADDWLALLKECGFSQADAWPKPGAPPEILGQHVILAQSPEGENTSFLGDPEFESGSASSNINEPHSSDSLESPVNSWTAHLLEALPGERLDLMLDYVRKNLKRVLRLDSALQLDRGQRLMDLGLDSLMALELRSQLTRGLGIHENALSATLAFDYPTVQALATYLLDELLKDVEQPGVANPDDIAADISEGISSTRKTQVAELSEEEVEALLLQKLNQRQNRK